MIDLFPKAILFILCWLPIQAFAMLDKENSFLNADRHNDKNLSSSETINDKKKELKIININLPARQMGTNNKAPAGKFSSFHNEIVLGQAWLNDHRTRTRIREAQLKQAELNVTLHSKLAKNNGADVEILLKLGANANFCSRDSETPIHIAYNNNNVEIIELLLRYGADPDILDESGSSLLHVACEFDDYELAEILLKYGADRYLLDALGRTCIDLAFKEEPTPENIKIHELLKRYVHHQKR